MRLGKGVQVFTHIPAVPTVRVSLTRPNLADVLRPLESPLAPNAAQLHQLLHMLAIESLDANNQPYSVSQVVVHTSGELLAAHLGFSEVTLYKHLKTLNRLGLIHSKGHTSSFYNLARKDGTLIAVSLKAGVKAQLRYWDMKASYRDLTADSQSGTRTAWAILQALKGGGVNSQSPQRKKLSYTTLRAWTLKEPDSTTPDALFDCKPPSPGSLKEYVYALPELAEGHPTTRNQMIEKLARVFALGFKDATNLKFWCWLLWRCFEGECRGEGSLYQLQNALTRLITDVQEWEGLKRPGALLVARLKEAGLWDGFGASS
jgi:biotin operon repressor